VNPSPMKQARLLLLGDEPSVFLSGTDQVLHSANGAGVRPFGHLFTNRPITFVGPVRRNRANACSTLMGGGMVFRLTDRIGAGADWTKP
jgi:hypothetical protein